MTKDQCDAWFKEILEDIRDAVEMGDYFTLIYPDGSKRTVRMEDLPQFNN